MSKDDGVWPAFPCPADANGFYGMTMRDYFAAHAVMALISSEKAYSLRAKGMAEAAFNIADAMLDARKVPR
jgi:hypothetical protein